MSLFKSKFSKKVGIEFGTDKGPSIHDKNVGTKEKSSIDAGLKGDIAKENANPQGESKQALSNIQKNPNLSKAIVAGVANVGIGAKVKPNKNVKFTPPKPSSR